MAFRPDDTVASYALVLRIPLDSIAELKRSLEEVRAKIIFQQVGAERLYITTEEPERIRRERLEREAGR